MGQFDPVKFNIFKLERVKHVNVQLHMTINGAVVGEKK